MYYYIEYIPDRIKLMFNYFIENIYIFSITLYIISINIHIYIYIYIYNQFMTTTYEYYLNNPQSYLEEYCDFNMYSNNRY